MHLLLAHYSSLSLCYLSFPHFLTFFLQFFQPRVNISFILINPATNRPFSATDTLDILEETDALTKLQSTIYRAERFFPAEDEELASSKCEVH